MTRLTQLIAIGAAMASMTIAAPASARHRPPLWAHGYETVSAVTPTTLVVKHEDGLEQKLPMAEIQVRAGIYPAVRDVLRPGEQVTVFQENQMAPLVVVHPATFGTLSQKGATWQVSSKRQGTMTLAGTNPILLGLTRQTAGTEVMVFGPASGQQIDVTALAARPLVARSTVQSANSRQMTMKSAQYGLLTYNLTGLPGRFREHLGAMSPGQAVVACLNPLDRQVLMVWPDRMERWAKTLERGSAGQVIAVSPKDLTLTNALGTVTIPLNNPTTIRWPGHPNAGPQQIPPGTRVVAVRERSGALKIMVVSPAK